MMKKYIVLKLTVDHSHYFNPVGKIFISVKQIHALRVMLRRFLIFQMNGHIRRSSFVNN